VRRRGRERAKDRASTGKGEERESAGRAPGVLQGSKGENRTTNHEPDQLEGAWHQSPV
jgi:hypothetical protein